MKQTINQYNYDQNSTFSNTLIHRHTHSHKHKRIPPPPVRAEQSTPAPLIYSPYQYRQPKNTISTSKFVYARTLLSYTIFLTVYNLLAFRSGNNWQNLPCSLSFLTTLVDILSFALHTLDTQSSNEIHPLSHHNVYTIFIPRLLFFPPISLSQY